MLYANINQIDKHDYLAERFRKGYEFLRSADLMSLPVGRVDTPEPVFVYFHFILL